MVKIGQILQEKGAGLSFEFFPPKEKAGEDRLFETISKLERLQPDYVSVTYGAGGGTRKNTMEVVKRLLKETSLVTMPHLTCINQSVQEIRTILEEYRDLGIENICALRGDPPVVDGKPVIPQDEPCHATHLVKLAKMVADFSIAVAGYPEGHIESPDLATDMFYTKLKVDTGADFIITQMFFENRYFFDFLERCQQMDIRVPIVPGIMPIGDINRMRQFCDKCGTTLPARTAERFEKAGQATDELKKISLDTVLEQCSDLQRHGIKYFHFFTLNNQVDVITNVVTSLGLRKVQEKV